MEDCLGQFIARLRSAFVSFAHVLLTRAQSYGSTLDARIAGKRVQEEAASVNVAFSLSHHLF